MRKELLVTLVFIAMLAAALVNVCCIEALADEVTSLVEAAADLMLAGDTISAEERATEAFRLWQSHGAYLNMVLKHSVFEACESDLIALLTEAYAGNAAGVLGMTEAVRRSMEAAVASERIRAASIF